MTLCQSLIELPPSTVGKEGLRTISDAMDDGYDNLKLFNETFSKRIHQ